jgi:Ca2+-binding RTX toxin-like protein
MKLLPEDMTFSLSIGESLECQRQADWGKESIELFAAPTASNRLNLPKTPDKQIIFIDSCVENWQQLASGVTAGTQVIILNPTGDGITQITQTLAKRSGFDSIQIVAHGKPASLQLSATNLDSHSIENDSNQLQQWQKSLIKNGDILLSAIVQEAVTKTKQIDPCLNIQTVSDIAPQAVQVMVEANQRIDTAASNNSGASLNTAIASIQKVALGETAKDFKEVTAGNKTIAEVVAENTGAALTSQIQTATVPHAPAVPVIGGGVEIISTAPNQIMGTNGNDAIAGTSGSDTISGQRGNDQILGLEGNDWINGNQDKDTIDGGIGDDTIYGGKGEDSLVGSNGEDVLFGNRGSDKIDGGESNDSLYGGRGNDLLTGGDGDDLLAGQIGEDTLVGGLGSDVFLLAPEQGIDTIIDFEKGQDLIGLSGGLNFSQLSFTSANNATLISVASSGQVLASLKGVAPNWLTIEDFTQRII